MEWERETEDERRIAGDAEGWETMVTRCTNSGEGGKTDEQRDASWPFISPMHWPQKVVLVMLKSDHPYFHVAYETQQANVDPLSNTEHSEGLIIC